MTAPIPNAELPPLTRPEWDVEELLVMWPGRPAAEVARLSEQLTMLSAPFPEPEEPEMTEITLNTTLEALSLWRWLTDAGHQPTRNGHRITVKAPASAIEDWRAAYPTAEAQKAQLRAALNPDILAKVQVAA